jgi:hypothetical protein
VACKTLDGKPPGSKPAGLTLPADQADDAGSRRLLLARSGSARISTIGSISGETHRESRRLEVAQRFSGLTLEIIELFYMLLLLNEAILELFGFHT